MVATTKPVCKHDIIMYIQYLHILYNSTIAIIIIARMSTLSMIRVSELN